MLSIYCLRKVEELKQQGFLGVEEDGFDLLSAWDRGQVAIWRHDSI